MTKHLLSAAAMLLVSTMASAESVELWKSATADGDLLNWGSQIEGTVISASKLTGVKAGDKILVNVVKFDTSIDKYPQVALKASDWSDLASGVVVSGQTMPYVVEFALTATQAETMAAGGFFPSGCAAWISSMTWEKSDVVVDPNAIWVGTKTFPDSEWWSAGDVSVPADNFANAAEGSKLVFVTSDRSSSFILQPVMGGWNNDNAVKINSNENPDRFITEGDKTTIVLTAAEAEQLKTNGLILQAGGCTVTQVILLPAGGTEDPKPQPSEIELFNGSEDMSNNYYPGLEIPKSKIIAAGADATLVIDYTKTGDGVSYKLCSEWTNSVIPSFKEVPGFQAEYSTVWTSAASPIKHVITAEDIKYLQDQGDSSFRICGGGDGFVITRVTIIPKADVSAIGAIGVDDENAPVEYFNLQGVRVENPSNGLYIRRQGKTVTKIIIK